MDTEEFGDKDTPKVGDKVTIKIGMMSGEIKEIISWQRPTKYSGCDTNCRLSTRGPLILKATRHAAAHECDELVLAKRLHQGVRLRHERGVIDFGVDVQLEHVERNVLLGAGVQSFLRSVHENLTIPELHNFLDINFAMSIEVNSASLLLTPWCPVV